MKEHRLAITFRSEPGNTLDVDARPSTGGCGFNASCDASVVPSDATEDTASSPPVDVCLGALVIKPGQTMHVSTCGAANIGDFGPCTFPGRPDVTFVADAPAGTLLTVAVSPAAAFIQYQDCSGASLTCSSSLTTADTTAHIFAIEAAQDAGCGEFGVTVVAK